jgi:hypothetical protein
LISSNNLLFSGDSIYLEHVLKRSAMNSFLTVKFDKCGKNKHDAISRKLSKAQEKVRGMLKIHEMAFSFQHY